MLGGSGETVCKAVWTLIGLCKAISSIVEGFVSVLNGLYQGFLCVCFKVLDDFVCGIYSLQPFVGSSRGLSFRRLGPETQSASYGDHMGGCQN